jgi:hypothetical protein
MVLMSPIRGYPGGSEIGQSRECPCPEEDGAGGGKRKAEALEQPERQERLDDQAPGEGIETEQGRQRQHDAARAAKRLRGRRAGLGGRHALRQAPVEQQREPAQAGVEQECRLQRRPQPGTQEFGGRFGQGGAEGAHGGRDRADEAVAGEERCAIAVAHHAGELRLLERQEDADVSRGRVERAEEGDDEQGPEVLEPGEGDPGQRHQRGGPDQQPPTRGAVGVEPYEKREEGRAGERRGRDHAGLERAVAEIEEIDRQQQTHEAIADRPQAARGEQKARLRRDAGGQDSRPSAHGAARDPRRQAIAPVARK